MTAIHINIRVIFDAGVALVIILSYKVFSHITDTDVSTHRHIDGLQLKQKTVAQDSLYTTKDVQPHPQNGLFSVTSAMTGSDSGGGAIQY
jgi:hypothetical protein